MRGSEELSIGTPPSYPRKAKEKIDYSNLALIQTKPPFCPRNGANGGLLFFY
jgi:hypothetical protein